MISAGVFWNRSGTTPLVTAETIFWRIGRDAVVDRVAARLLVIGDDLLERDILFFGEPLCPPYRRRRGRGVGDIRAPEYPGRSQRQRAAKHRTPVQLAHPRLLPCS